jgi:glycolate oxidase FAD binding subunit
MSVAAIEHSPLDMVVTAPGDVTVAELQAHVARKGQWLAIDPPAPERLTVAELLAANQSGPRRFGCGTIRDYTLGIAARLSDGRLIHSGGKVVKNVAGYDLQKLFIGGQGTLGIIMEATFKLRPLPESEQFAQKTCASLAEAGALIEKILDSPLTPIVLDLRWPFTVVLDFAGTKEEVAWQLERAGDCGISEPATLDYDAEFRSRPNIGIISVLPSKLVETLAALGERPFVARAGNGVIYCEGAVDSALADLPRHLFARVKEAFDPLRKFPAFPV